jgi:hypothetical protein
MAEPILFEPELEQLIREIAADPRSHLLRIPRPAAIRSLHSREREVSANATGLTLAERELVRVYRCEAAKLLREACVMRVMNHPEGKTWLVSHLTPVRQLRLRDTDDWSRRAQATLADATAHRGGLDGIELIETCVSHPDATAVSVAELAAASLRLEPADPAWIYPAIESVHEGRFAAALHSLERLLETPTSPWHRTFVWTQIGRAKLSAGDPSGALLAYKRVVELDASRIAGSLGWCAAACEIGDARQFAAAAEHLDSVLPVLHEATLNYASAIAGARTRCKSRAFAPRLARLREGLGPNSTRIADALTYDA